MSNTPNPVYEKLMKCYESFRSMTGGSGDFSYEFARYEQAPSDIQAKEIEARASKVEKAEE